MTTRVRPPKATTTHMTRPLADIHIGKRHRSEMGNVEALAASIEDIGLLHPITVDGENNLLAGARRLAACRSLGWTTIPVIVVNA
jgi:ParB family chromosome partitioning protein